MRRTDRGIVFDLGKVLVDFDWDAALEAITEFSALSPAEARDAAFGSGLHEQYETGRIGTPAFLAGMAKAMKLSIPPEEFARLYTEIFVRRPAMESLFSDALARAPVAILSDTCPLHWEYILRLSPLLSTADFAALSFEIGSRKPGARNYRAAAAGLGLTPEACFFLDDRKENVLGAVRTGMTAALYTSPEDARERVMAWLEG